jgi:hypothetical protein
MVVMDIAKGKKYECGSAQCQLMKHYLSDVSVLSLSIFLFCLGRLSFHAYRKSAS